MTATLNDIKGSDTWIAITLSDTTVYSASPRSGDSTVLRPRALFVGVGGDLAIADITGAALTFKNVPSGTLLPVQPTKVMTTNTTATNVLGLY